MKTTTITTITTAQPLVEAHLTINRNRLKVHDGNIVYMKDGSEFQIEFRNITTIMQKASISINGKLQDNDLVLRPGQHYYLDRFLNDKSKMVFRTYDVDDVDEVKKAIENNGLIEISFYSESVPLNVTYTYDTYNYDFTGGLGGTALPYNKVYNSRTTSNTTNSALYSGTPIQVFNSGGYIKPSNIPDSIETGRVEKGNTSNQEFEFVNYSFNSYAHTTIKYKILPISAKPRELTSKDLRSYCNSCGRRAKNGWIYCAGCGNKI